MYGYVPHWRSDHDDDDDDGLNQCKLFSYVKQFAFAAPLFFYSLFLDNSCTALVVILVVAVTV